MKTLDEVIKAHELCIPRGIHCRECPYNEDDCTIGRKRDALHYLQAYKQLSEALVSENVEWSETGIFCKRCGLRLDKVWEL